MGDDLQLKGVDSLAAAIECAAWTATGRAQPPNQGMIAPLDINMPHFHGASQGLPPRRQQDLFSTKAAYAGDTASLYRGCGCFSSGSGRRSGSPGPSNGGHNSSSISTAGASSTNINDNRDRFTMPNASHAEDSDHVADAEPSATGGLLTVGTKQQKSILWRLLQRAFL